MREKTFDCVHMKRRGAARVYEKTKDMTLDEEVAYWAQRTEELRRRLEAVRGEGEAAPEEEAAETEAESNKP